MNNDDNQMVPCPGNLLSAADVLQESLGEANTKELILDLILLKHISEGFNKRRKELELEGYTDPENRNSYSSGRAFYIPPSARWNEIVKQIKKDNLTKSVNQSISLILKENPGLENVLTFDYEDQRIDNRRLGLVVEMIDKIPLTSLENKSDNLVNTFEQIVSRFPGHGSA